MDLFESYTRFSCSLIKLNLQRAKITIPLFQQIYLIHSPPMNELSYKRVPCLQAKFATIFHINLLTTLFCRQNVIDNMLVMR